MKGQYDAFISYSHKDKEWVENFVRDLQNMELRVWWDVIIKKGASQIRAIEEGLKNSRAFIPVISERALESEWVENEFHQALRLSIDSNYKFRIIPVRIQSVDVPGFLGNFAWIDFVDELEYQTNITNLVMEIKGEPLKINSPSAEDSSFELHEILRRTKKRVTVSGNTLNKFTSDEKVKSALEQLLIDNKEVTLILLNPSSSYARAHEFFHSKESNVYPMEKQFNSTISYLESIRGLAKNPSNYRVYLSNYMPRFRTILIDDEVCYVYLYMYGVDVTKTPEFIIKKSFGGKSAEWFAIIENSVKQLLKSLHIFPVIEGTKFHKNWPQSDMHLTLLNCLNTRCCAVTQCQQWERVRKSILGYQNDDDRKAIKEGLCNDDYEPGTYTLANAPALQTPDAYNSWIDRILDDHLKLLSNTYGYRFGNASIDIIKNNVKAILELGPKGFSSLKEEIWFQEYSDIIHQIILIFLEENSERYDNLYPHLTTEKEEFMQEVIRELEVKSGSNLKEWLYYSVAAGLLGVDQKSIHAATSVIDKSQAISIDRSSSEVAEELYNIARSPKARDDSDIFFEMLRNSERLNPSGGDIRMVAFTDDFMETMILLKFYEKLLMVYQKLSITCVPRIIRCSNDATHEDIDRFLTYHYLKDLNHFPLRQRFEVSKNGPKLGGVNLKKLDEKLIRILKGSHFIDVRGARNYEMMQRVNKEMFFGFMVCRQISAQVTGLDIKDRPFFFIHQGPGQCSFITNKSHGNWPGEGK